MLPASTIPFIRRRVFSQSRKPFTENGMPQISPSFIQRHQCWRAVQPLLNPAEQIEQHRNHCLVIELQQALGFKREEPAITEQVFVGIQQMAQRTGQRIELEGFPDFQILNVGAEFGKRSGWRKTKLL